MRSKDRIQINPRWTGIWLVLMLLTASAAQAKIISVNGLLSKVLETNRNMRSFYMELEARIYDPESFSPLDEPMEENLVSVEVKENAFFQKIVWVRDEYYLVETLDFSETALHMYIFEPVSRDYGRNLQKERLFANEDIVYPYLAFFTKHIAYIKTSLERMGINAAKVSIRQRESDVVYQLGDEAENILVDPISYKILEINRLVQIGGRFFPLQILFDEWDRTYPELPVRTRFYINSRLFKEMRILLKQRRVYTERRHFLTKYYKTLPPVYPFSLNILYAN